MGQKEDTRQHPALASIRGTGLPVVMVHGNGVDHRILLALDQHVAAAEKLQRVYLDLLGFGANPPLEGLGGLPELAQWLEQYLRRLVAQRPFALLGSSLGGLLAQEMAERFGQQVRGLALLAPVTKTAPVQRTLPPRSILRTDPILLEQLSNEERSRYTQMAVVQSPENWECFRRFALPGIRAANLRAMARLAKRYFLESLPKEQTIRSGVAVLIICGRQDHVVGFEDSKTLLQRYPAAKHLVLENAGHNVHVDQPDLVGQAVYLWARQLLASAQV